MYMISPQHKHTDPTQLPTLASRKHMRAFFKNWIRNAKITARWNQNKTDARYAIAAFLQSQSATLADPKRANWLEESINTLEELEKLQLKQRFITAHIHSEAHTPQAAQNAYGTEIPFQSAPTHTSVENTLKNEVMIFMPATHADVQLKMKVTDVLRKGLTYTRAFLTILNLHDTSIMQDGSPTQTKNLEVHTRLEVQLHLFKKHIYTAYQLQNKGANKPRGKKALQQAMTAYDVLMDSLAEALVHIKVYKKITDAMQGIIHMAALLWSNHYSQPSIHIQHASKDHAHLLIFEPSCTPSSGNTEASWVKTLAKAHPWIKRLPWQILQRPQPLHTDGARSITEKVTLVLVKKVRCAENAKKKNSTYFVDCTPLGELGAVPAPCTRDNAAERYNATLLNQKALYLGNHVHNDAPPFPALEETIFTQLRTLSALLTKARCKQGITIPLTNIYLTQKKFPSVKNNIPWLQEKTNAGKEIRHILNRYAIYYDAAKIKCIYLDKHTDTFTMEQKKLECAENYIPIYIQYYDPTIFHYAKKTYPHKTFTDRQIIQAALYVAEERLEIFKEKLSECPHHLEKWPLHQEAITDIATVQQFLKNKAILTLHAQKIPDFVTQATCRLSEKLREVVFSLQDNPHSNRKVHLEILKILQSGLLIKSEYRGSLLEIVHATIHKHIIALFLTIPRKTYFKNIIMARMHRSKIFSTCFSICASPFFFIEWALRVFLKCSSALVKTPRTLRHTISLLKNKSPYLAAAAGILFSGIGKKNLHCKNTADRALSVLLTSSNLIHQAIHGEPLSGKNPLMTDAHIPTLEKILAYKQIQYQHRLKATGLIM
jgi:hypothetical protein